MDCCCVAEKRGNTKVKLNIVTPECRCGGHIQYCGTLEGTVEGKVSQGCKCVQMFLGSATGYDVVTISKEDKERTRQYCEKHNTSVYVHCSLIANLAKQDLSPKVLPCLQKQLDIVNGLPASCVLHIGKVGTIENVAQRINMLNIDFGHYSHMPYPLLLEIAAGQGTELGYTYEQIRHLYEGIDRTRVGLCVDTQHAFAAGMCNFQTHEDVVSLFEKMQYITPKGISMIHINDSAKPFGSRVDRHAPLKQGYIWQSSDEGLRSLVQISTDKRIDLISETTDILGDINTIMSYQ